MTLEEHIGEIVDKLAAIPDEKVNPDMWRQLLIYIPAWLVAERVKKDKDARESGAFV